MTLGELHRCKNKEDFLRKLPQEMWRKILGKLPIRSIMRCKCVCKSWRHLIEGGEFATSYTPQLALAFAHRDRYMGYTVCDEAFQPLYQFDLPLHNSSITHARVVIDSANGLLLVWEGCPKYHNLLFICNPMTREYVELPHLPIHRCIYGFGVSKLSGQYKILCGDQYRPRHVYTLERGGFWRSIAAATTDLLPRLPGDGATFLNGNLHWLVSDLHPNLLVCCFDLETELFTTFSLPPRDPSDHRFGGYGNYGLCILEGRLCLCDISDHLHVVIWKMNNYGDANSWVQEYAFDQYTFGQPPDNREIVLPLKVFANGDLLFAVNIDDRLFTYSKDTEALVPFGPLQRSLHYYFSNIFIYTPSFLSLKTMGIPNVRLLSFH